MANRYTRALKQIKDKTIDEKLELLEELPTNSTVGLYVDTPGYADPEIEIPGPIDSPLDLEEDGQGQEDYTGNDTTGLFASDGTIKAIEPPGDTTAILGPMISMWYAWANYTQIGYVRESDRRMVNLGRITGQIADWDGESGFTSYGQLTLEQAVWYKDQARADYRAFYPGPPSNEPDQYGRYIGSIITTSKNTSETIPQNPFKRYTPGTNRTYNASDNFSLQQKAQLVAGYGLRPDGTMGPSKLGDTNRGHDGTLYKLVPRPGYGYNMWIPVKKAASDFANAVYASHEPKGKVLTEDRKRILRDIKKPVQVKEIPTKFKVKPTGKKNKTVGVDMMKVPETQHPFKPEPKIWNKGDREKNIKASQERKNEVLELVGAAEHHWTYLTEDSRKKKQEKVNEMMSAEYDKQMELLYEQYKQKENKVNKTISAVKKNNNVEPKDAPPEPELPTVMPNGYHSQYGKHYKHDKLDPHSAEFMPPTGDPEIDANIKKATNQKEKSRKLKILLGKGSKAN